MSVNGKNYKSLEKSSNQLKAIQNELSKANDLIIKTNRMMFEKDCTVEVVLENIKACTNVFEKNVNTYMKCHATTMDIENSLTTDQVSKNHTYNRLFGNIHITVNAINDLMDSISNQYKFTEHCING